MNLRELAHKVLGKEGEVEMADTTEAPNHNLASLQDLDNIHLPETKLDEVSDKLRELTKLANFHVDDIWEDAVRTAKAINSDTNAVVAAATDAYDDFDRLGRVLKIFGHNVEGVWDHLVSFVKKHG